MNGRTHLITGIVSGVIFASAAPVTPLEQLLIIGVCGAGSLFPDVDHPNSIIGRRVKPLSWIITKTAGHRGITHSIVFMLLISFVLSLMDPNSYVLGSFIIGYISHLILDGITPHGIPALYPLPLQIKLNPLHWF